jgi:hypothetical protein
MAQKITKDVPSVLNTRKELIWRVYNHILNDGVTWSITYTEGNWTSAATVANADYFVASSTDGQQFMIAAHDSTGSLTFGGAADSTYTLSAYSIGIVYSPTGGWVLVDKLFTGATIPPEYKQKAIGSSSVAFNRVSIISNTDAMIVFFMSKSTTPPTVSDDPQIIYFGEIESGDTAMVDPNPYALFFGTPLTTNIAGNLAATAIPVGRVINSLGTLWENAFVNPTTYPSVGYGQTKNGNLWAEFDVMYIFDAAATKYAGKMKYVKRIDSNAGTLNTNQGPVSRAVIGDLTVPWE